MITRKINGLNVELYDSIEELPIKRFEKYNHFLLLDSGIGSDLNDVSHHKDRILAFIDEGKLEDAKVELDNYVFSIENIIREMNYQHLAFACLVKSINGKTVVINTDADAEAVRKRFSTAKKGVVDLFCHYVKKKLSQK